MIWNDATDVILNGASVQAVYCNNQMVWPPMTAEPDAWTMMIVSSYNGNLYGSEVGFDIYDATHRKVYSTNGIHPVSSYELTSNCIYVSASGVSPFNLRISASGSPYNVLRMQCDQFTRSTPVLSGSGSFVSASGTMADSLKDSAKFPTAMEDPSAILGSSTTVSRAYVREYPKQIWVSGSALSQYNSSTSASMFLFVPTTPTATRIGGGTLTASADNYTAYTTGIKPGYFTTYNSVLQSSASNVSAFDMFHSIEHSGNVIMWTQITPRNTIMTAVTNTNDNCSYSIFPAALVNENTLSGGSKLNPTSVALATVYSDFGGYGSFYPGSALAYYSYEAASDHAYIGAYCTYQHSGQSGDKMKCSSTIDMKYTASTYIP